MFALAAKGEIGRYLTRRIDERFKSHREFCREYLKDTGEEADGEPLKKMSNRLSQILKGKKEIQLYDLPVFCRLLEISCEDILSAGKSHAPSSAHLTNYAVALSKDERVWEKYIRGEDSHIARAAEFRKKGLDYAAEIEKLKGTPILNADEYGQTVIDYALEAENYELLKYLMDKKYIWFVGTDEKDYSVGFGAGTSIESAIFPYHRNWGVLNSQLKMRDELRTHMVALAIQHGDLEMLKQLRARETPDLYQFSRYFTTPEKYEKYRNEKLMDAITRADDRVLEFFSGEFEIDSRFGFVNRFTCPFLGELIENLLRAKAEFAEYMLKEVIRHNQYVYDQLTALLAEAVELNRKMGYYNHYDLADDVMRRDMTQDILGALHFYEDGSLVAYFAMLPDGMKRRLQSNIIRVNAESSDTMINRRISELNDLYDAIHNITPKFERGQEYV